MSSYTKEDIKEIISILKEMIDYDFGYPAFSERYALKCAIEIIEEKIK